jgi:hypothetical protein
MPVIAATLEVEIRRITVQGPFRKKASKISISTNKLDIVAHIFNPSYAGGVGKRIAV